MPREFLEFSIFSVSRFLEFSSSRFLDFCVAYGSWGGGGVVAPLPEKEDPGVEEPDPIWKPDGRGCARVYLQATH